VSLAAIAEHRQVLGDVSRAPGQSCLGATVTMKAGAKASSGPRNSTGNSSAYPKGGPAAKLRRPQVVNAKAKVDTRRPRSSSPARPRPEQQQASGPPVEEVFDERKTRAVSPKYRSRSGGASGSTRLAKESEELPQERRSSSPQSRTTPRVTMEALQAENSWLKQQVERQRAEIQELRSQVPVPSEPIGSWLGVTIPQVSSRSTTPGKVQSTYVSTATRNVVVAAACPCQPAPLTTPASLTPRMVRVAPTQPAEPVSTPRLVENAYPVYMPVVYPSYAAGQVLPHGVQPQVLRFHSVGHTQTLG